MTNQDLKAIIEHILKKREFLEMMKTSCLLKNDNNSYAYYVGEQKAYNDLLDKLSKYENTKED